jgi:hypothetical protein
LNSVWSTYNSQTNLYGGEIREDLVLSTANAKENYAKLLERQDEVEAALRARGVTEAVHWYNPENAQLCRVYVRRDATVDDRGDWASQQGWLLDRAEAFLAVFAPIVKGLRVPQIPRNHPTPVPPASRLAPGEISRRGPDSTRL